MEREISVLLANENNEELNEIEKFLSKDNNIINIDKASNGKDALEFLMSKNYDLIIVDFILPNQSELFRYHVHSHTYYRRAETAK